MGNVPKLKEKKKKTLFVFFLAVSGVGLFQDLEL
jgi:hypothetical protein